MIVTKRNLFHLTAGLTLMGLAFIFDTYTPLGVVDGMLYLPLILLTLFVREMKFTLAAGFMATLLIVLGYFYSPPALDVSNAAITNRMLSIFSGWMIVMLIFIYQRSAKKALFYEERLSALFKHAQEGIIVVTPEEAITLTNPRVADLFGYEDHELAGKNFNDLLPSLMNPADFSCYPRPDLDNLNAYAGTELIFCARRKDGTHFPVRVNIWNTELSEKKHFIFFIFDITEMIQQQKELNKAHTDLLVYAEELKTANYALEERVDVRTKELRDMVEKLENINTLLQEEMINRELAVIALRENQLMQETIADHFPNGMLAVLDRNLRFVYARGQEINSSDRQQDDLKGQMFFKLVEDEDNLKIETLLRRTFKGEKISFEYREPHNGNYYLFTAAALPNSQGEIHQILVVSQNISHQKKAEYEIRNALEKEKELNEMKSRFVTTASHEFRTPLAAIVSSASLISMYKTTEDEPKRKKHVVRITSSVSNLTEILNDFLSIGKIEEGKVKNLPSEFDLVDLCEDIKEEIAGISKPGQEIKTSYKLRESRVVMDKQLLRNILINLLSNAVKYSPQAPAVFMDVYQRNGSLSFSVVDQGIGIPPADQKHLFETFYRASNVENIKGTGMGLHIVKKYLEILKGSIEFESQPNKGTRFVVTFNN